MSNSQQLLLPIEIKAREFDAKLLLSLAACRAGIRVLLGERYVVEANIGSSKGAIYFGKDVTLPNAPLYRELTSLGHRIAALDEEALVYYTPEIYRHRRFHPETCDQVSCLFACGDDNAALWQSLPGYHGTPIITSGNPRFDLLSPRFQHLYRSDAEALREKYGDFVLISSNFGHVNPFRQGEKKMPTWDEIQSGAVKKPRYYDRRLSEHRNWLFKRFGKAVQDLVAAMPGQKFILRPHPNESQKHWHDLLNGRDNVEVLHEGSVLPWILASRLLIHNGCTTAIEAAVLGRRTLAYTIDQDHPHEIRLPNRISLEAPSGEALLDLARRCLDVTATSSLDKELAGRRQLLKTYIADLNGKLAVEQISEHLAELPPAARGPSTIERAAALWKAQRRRRKFYKKVRRRSEERQAWHRHVFPPTNRNDVLQRLDKLAIGLDNYQSYEIIEHDCNLFEMIPNNKIKKNA